MPPKRKAAAPSVDEPPTTRRRAAATAKTTPSEEPATTSPKKVTKAPKSTSKSAPKSRKRAPPSDLLTPEPDVVPAEPPKKRGRQRQNSTPVASTDYPKPQRRSKRIAASREPTEDPGMPPLSPLRPQLASHGRESKRIAELIPKEEAIEAEKRVRRETRQTSQLSAVEEASEEILDDAPVQKAKEHLDSIEEEDEEEQEEDAGAHHTEGTATINQRLEVSDKGTTVVLEAVEEKSPSKADLPAVKSMPPPSPAQRLTTPSPGSNWLETTTTDKAVGMPTANDEIVAKASGGHESDEEDHGVQLTENDRHSNAGADSATEERARSVIDIDSVTNDEERNVEPAVEVKDYSDADDQLIEDEEINSDAGSDVMMEDQVNSNAGDIMETVERDDSPAQPSDVSTDPYEPPSRASPNQPLEYPNGLGSLSTQDLSASQMRAIDAVQSIDGVKYIERTTRKLLALNERGKPRKNFRSLTPEIDVSEDLELADDATAQRRKRKRPLNASDVIDTLRREHNERTQAIMDAERILCEEQSRHLVQEKQQKGFKHHQACDLDTPARHLQRLADSHEQIWRPISPEPAPSTPRFTTPVNGDTIRGFFQSIQNKAASVGRSLGIFTAGGDGNPPQLRTAPARGAAAHPSTNAPESPRAAAQRREFEEALATNYVPIKYRSGTRPKYDYLRTHTMLTTIMEYLHKHREQGDWLGCGHDKEDACRYVETHQPRGAKTYRMDAELFCWDRIKRPTPPANAGLSIDINFSDDEFEDLMDDDAEVEYNYETKQWSIVLPDENSAHENSASGRAAKRTRLLRETQRDADAVPQFAPIPDAVRNQNGASSEVLAHVEDAEDSEDDMDYELEEACWNRPPLAAASNVLQKGQDESVAEQPSVRSPVTHPSYNPLLNSPTPPRPEYELEYNLLHGRVQPHEQKTAKNMTNLFSASRKRPASQESDPGLIEDVHQAKATVQGVNGCFALGYHTQDSDSDDDSTDDDAEEYTPPDAQTTSMEPTAGTSQVQPSEHIKSAFTTATPSLAAARAVAEKHKPKTPSGLRSVTRYATDSPSTPLSMATKAPVPGLSEGTQMERTEHAQVSEEVDEDDNSTLYQTEYARAKSAYATAMTMEMMNELEEELGEATEEEKNSALYQAEFARAKAAYADDMRKLFQKSA